MNTLSLNGSDWSFKEFVGMDWVWRNSIKSDTKDTRWWYKATVPGSVLHDLWQEGKVPDPHFELNSKLVEWVSARTWVYRKKFTIPNEIFGRKITLCFEGIDYNAEIFLNGESIKYHEGMYIPCEVDVTDKLIQGDNLLAVVIEAAPEEQPQVGKTSRVKTHKARMNYWWDFCPRMIHQGIWDSVYLRITGQEMLKDVFIKTELNSDYSCAKLIVEIEAESRDGCEVIMNVNSETISGKIRGNKVLLVADIMNPILWQPNGYGEPYQYEVRIVLFDSKGNVSDSRTMKYGIRYIEFVKNERCNPKASPYLLKVNGRKIYINGYNWVPMDAMYGVERYEKLKRLMRLAREAHVVMFRVWGGGLIEKDSFYESCAENGILVWQEFIQSSSGIDNKPPENSEFIDMLIMQAEIIIRRKRNHTALAIWCGGNELSDWEGNPVENSDPLIAKLKEVVNRLDPQKRWLPSSPSGGVFNNSMKNIIEQPDMLWDVHGPWEHQGLQHHCELYNNGTSLLLSEFGVEGMTNKNTLEKSVSKEHMLPANKDNEIYFHRGAWWTNEPLIQETFGGLDNIDQIRTASQYMQYEGLKYAIECNRRRAFQNSGTFPWQYNEPYPNTYCTSSLDYYANPKPAYYGVKSSYEQVMISAAFNSPSLAEQQEFVCETFLSSVLLEDEVEKLGSMRLQCEVIGTNGEICFLEAIQCILPVNSTEKLSDIKLLVKDIPTTLFILRMKLIDGKGDCIAENEYLFTKEKDLADMFGNMQPELLFHQQDKNLTIQNIGEDAALFLFLSNEEALPHKDYIYFSHNYFSLLPNEKRILEIDTDSGVLSGKTISVENFLYKTNVTFH